jgi:toxin-antitoxin system PIN domain toxin
MIFLPDVNVWIALTSARHVHQPIANEWLRDLAEDRVAFCRISELGFLRLLTNAHVMANDVLTPVEAWGVYDEWRADDRVVFLRERADFSEEWRRLGNQLTGGPNVWTDGYLATFARNANATIVTLDRRFAPVGDVAIKVLG